MTSTATAAKLRERPITFTTDMVKAILDGRKTQTRRIIKEAPEAATALRLNSIGRYLESYLSELREWVPVVGPHGCETMVRCPKGIPGDHLWVKETYGFGWQSGHGWYSAIPVTGKEKQPEKIFYKADPKWDKWDENKGQLQWRNVRFMPRFASRLTLEITNVRVERLQQISEADAIAEGVRQLRDGSGTFAGREGPGKLVTPWLTAKEAFADGWDAINARRGFAWSSDVWVWVIEFKKIDSRAA